MTVNGYFILYLNSKHLFGLELVYDYIIRRYIIPNILNQAFRNC